MIHRDKTSLLGKPSAVAYLGHGGKKNYSANRPGRNTNPPGHISYSAQADYSEFRPGRLQHIPPGRTTIPPGQISSSARVE